MRIAFPHLGREHLGIEYLSAVLKQAGHETMLALDPGLFGPEDNVFCSPSLEKLADQRERIIHDVLAFDPDLVAFSVYTSTYRWACELARVIKAKSGAPTVFGGIHATLVPEVVIQNEFVDFVVVGEGEYPLLELVESLGRGQLDPDIRNLWLKQNGHVKQNELRPPIDPLDSLPYPDKELFEKDINYRDDYLILTNRGCVYNCSYCCESFLGQLYGRKRYFRRRAVDSVIQELKHMKKRYRFREVMFNDPILFTDRDWLRELMTKFRAEIGVPFRCFGQVMFLDEEVGEMLKQGGCYAVEFGIQTLNESIKRQILNRKESNEHCEQAFQVCEKLRLRYDVDHIFGLPDESEEDHRFAAEFYSRWSYLNRIKCHNLTYFPKLEIISAARDRGMVDEEELRNVENGVISDFFHHDAIADPQLKRSKQAFQILFKMLPVLPRRVVSFMLRRGIHYWLRYLPSPFVILSQCLVAIKGRDYRYLLYVKYYWLRLRRIFRRGRSWPRGGRRGLESVRSHDDESDSHRSK